LPPFQALPHWGEREKAAKEVTRRELSVCPRMLSKDVVMVYVVK
jgi:hypothetical protein